VDQTDFWRRLLTAECCTSNTLSLGDLRVPRATTRQPSESAPSRQRIGSRHATNLLPAENVIDELLVRDTNAHLAFSVSLFASPEQHGLYTKWGKQLAVSWRGKK
jgi:hypothetical protein